MQKTVVAQKRHFSFSGSPSRDEINSAEGTGRGSVPVNCIITILFMFMTSKFGHFGSQLN